METVKKLKVSTIPLVSKEIHEARTQGRNRMSRPRIRCEHQVRKGQKNDELTDANQGRWRKKEALEEFYNYVM